MQRYEVAYFECAGCHSLQTEEPWWLDEAYGRPPGDLDVGRAQRNLVTATLCAHILGSFGLEGTEPCLDWGGAEGLFCRFMRDRGFNFFSYDKYIEPRYSMPYRVDVPATFSPAAVTAFEVLEHLPQPAEELKAIFGLGPRLLLFSTELYDKHGDDWMYLSLVSGRHVFFYSRAAMDWIASRFGCRYIRFPFLHAFVKNGTWEKSTAAFRAMAASPDTLLFDAAQGLVAHLTGDAWRYIQRDFLQIRKTQFGV